MLDDFDAVFDRVGAFLQPRSDWAAYYEPLLPALPRFRARHPGDAEAEQVAALMETEIAAWRAWGDHVGYLFMIGRRRAS